MNRKTASGRLQAKGKKQWRKTDSSAVPNIAGSGLGIDHLY